MTIYSHGQQCTQINYNELTNTTLYSNWLQCTHTDYTVLQQWNVLPYMTLYSYRLQCTHTYDTILTSTTMYSYRLQCTHLVPLYSRRWHCSEIDGTILAQIIMRSHRWHYTKTDYATLSKTILLTQTTLCSYIRVLLWSRRHCTHVDDTSGRVNRCRAGRASLWGPLLMATSTIPIRQKRPT